MSAWSRRKRTQEKVKKEPKERRERTPPFEEEEDEEFLPKERRDTWRDYEGRGDELRHLGKGAGLPHPTATVADGPRHAIADPTILMEAKRTCQLPRGSQD